MYKITAVLKSPLMIGGKTLNSNYRESRNYIPGSVLRAAYAKAVIQRCSYQQDHYWLHYIGQAECNNCPFKTICKNFSELSFPTLYPAGSAPYPMTARGEKYKQQGENKVLDILKSRLTMKEKLAEEAGLERLDGLHKDGEDINLIYSIITRTAIDYECNSSKQGSLYTQNVISGQYSDEKKEITEVLFSGEIKLSPEEEKELSAIKILHVGADITRGFGMCYMSYEKMKDEEKDTPEKIAARIQEFNSNIAKEKQFVVLDLLTDAYLDLEQIEQDTISTTEVSNEKFLMFLEKKINLPVQKCHLFKVFKQQEVLRGFDTSKKTEKEMQRKGHLVVKAGAVFVYYAAEKDIDVKKLWEFEQQGIGNYREHGFGKIHICDSFHIKYDAFLKGENRNG